MKRLLVFLTIIAVGSAVDGFAPGVRVKFGMGSNPDAGLSYFYKIPLSVENATAMGWENTERPCGTYMPQLCMYCPADHVVCCFYDDTGYIAGVQVAISKSDFSDNVFDWEKRGFTSWDTQVDGKCKSFWTIQQFYVNNKFLAISRKKRIASRDCSRILQASALWVTGINKKLTKISNNEKEIIRQKLFLKQACIPGMGQHYYYNMSRTTRCSYDQAFPWFTMFKNGELSAVAFLTFGKLSVPSGERDWFEHSNLAVVKALIPYGPPWVYALGADPGALTMHIFFVNEPWTITCPA